VTLGARFTRYRVWGLVLALALGLGAVALWFPRQRPAPIAGAREGAALRSAAAPASREAAPPAPGLVPGRLPAPDPQGRIRVPVADRVPPRLPAEGVPPGWSMKEFAGKGWVELVRDGTRLSLRLRSEGSSFALYRDVVVDLKAFPVLTWSWKVVRLPDQGDVRDRAADDQAAQVYVVFPRWPAPLRNSDVIGYVWDSRAPIGTKVTSTQAGNVRIVVVASGPSQLDTWRVEHRHVARDYADLFGRQPPRVGQVAVMIDTNDTKATAETLIGDLFFSRARAENMEMPTSMLR
jgi:Protein of unknown function (DUF3047)